MTMTTTAPPVPAASGDELTSDPLLSPGRPTRLRRFVRGRDADPPWVRPALVALLASTGVLYLWGLGASGWANTYYSAAVQAAAHSWKAFLFGSFDSANAITVDKTPAFLWPMALSARIFGVSSWSILVPQALEGVAAVGVLYLAVRRWFTPGAALLAGLTLATTPIAALMFRFNNPDALLVLLLTVAGYALVRALESASSKWVAICGAAVGFAFLAKMLQAFLVLPAFALAYLVWAPTPVRRRLQQLLLAGASMVAAAGWWVAIVMLVPASSRPYIGGSQDGTFWNLLFGYNGFGRLNGNESGSVGGGPAGQAGRWGATGLTRLFGSDWGGQISWLLPAVAVLAVAAVALTWRSPTGRRTRAAIAIWGGWLVVTALAFSLGKGIIHSYYSVALAPPVAAIAGIGAATLWAKRHEWLARAAMAATISAAVVWSWVLLGRTPTWHPALRTVLLVAGLVTAVALVVVPALERRVALALAAAAIVTSLGGQAAWAVATAATPHTGAIPSSGPAGAARIGGPGGPGGGPGGRPGGAFAPPANAANGGQFAGGPPPGMTGGPFGGRPGTAAGGPAGGPGGAGGLLNGSTPSAALTTALQADAGRYTWVAAVTGANQAAGYQLASDQPVLAIGGFNGTDPYPSLAAFQALVSTGRIHYYIAGGGMGGGGPQSSASTSAITSWVTSHFTATTIGGTTVYDLTATPSA